MAPVSEEEKRKDLKAKLASKMGGSHKTQKETKAVAKDKADKVAKDEERAKKEKIEKLKAEKEALRIKVEAAKAAPPSVYADLADEASQIGIHIGISCDGCGHKPPVIGKAWKCKDCPDFDLCDECYPERLDQQREVVAAAAGMAGKGRHPAKHCFHPRKAHTPLTPEAVVAEKRAARDPRPREQDTSTADEKTRLLERARKAREAGGGTGFEAFIQEALAGTSGRAAGRGTPLTDESIALYRPTKKMAHLLPVPDGHPRILGPL